MEFNEKLQELRKQKGLTQEELAKSLYVSRTAISKWESGRGYPSIESLKAIAKFFSITVDGLISTDEVLTIAEEDSKQSKGRFRSLICGALDISALGLIFLPLFASRSADTVSEVSLLMLTGIHPWLRLLYFISVIGLGVIGIATLALQGYQNCFFNKLMAGISVALGGLAVLLFVLGLHPYAAIFALFLLAFKVFILIKRQ